MSDDVRFFYNPWEYDGPRDAAVARLIEVATGGAYDPGLRRDRLNGSLGIAKSDAAAFIVGTTLTTIAGRPPPEKPRPRVRADFRAFDGVLVDRHTTEDGSVYVWVTFGLPSDDSSSSSSSSDDEDSPGGSEAVQKAAAQKPQQPTQAAAAGAEQQGQAPQGAAKQQAGEQQQLEGQEGQEEADSDGEGGGSSSSSSSSSDEEAAADTGQRGAARKGNKGGGSGRGGGGGGRGRVDPATVVDAEFIFPEGDSIVNVRAASRAEPGVGGGRLALSFEQGVVFDRNEARRQLEALRKALRWEPIVVLSNDDPRYNSDRPLFFERLFDPFVKTGRQNLPQE